MKREHPLNARHKTKRTHKWPRNSQKAEQLLVWTSVYLVVDFLKGIFDTSSLPLSLAGLSFTNAHRIHPYFWTMNYLRAFVIKCENMFNFETSDSFITLPFRQSARLVSAIRDKWRGEMLLLIGNETHLRLFINGGDSW